MNNLLLNRIFTKNTIKTLIEDEIDENYTAVIENYIEDVTDKNHGQIISEVYKNLKENYRNEYYYKNTLLNKLLFGIHSPTTTTALIEVPINKSKADFILINGKAVVYEIKTELDTCERLNSQLNDYYKAFPNVCVVTSKDNLKNVEKKLEGSNVGIYLLTNKNSLKSIKKYKADYSQLNLDIIFKILRKDEYEIILKNKFNYLPTVSDFDYYEECKRMFVSINIMDAYEMVIKELKKRNKINTELFKKVPIELRSVIYFSRFKEKDYHKLNNFLHKNIGEEYVFSLP